MKKIILWNLLIIAMVVALIYNEYIYFPGLNKQLKVGTTYMTMNNTFYGVINNEIINYVSSHNGRVYTRDPVLNEDKQVAEIHDLLKLGINVLIINPVNGRSQKICHAIAQAKASGCHIVVIDTPMSDDRNVDVTIASDNYHIGVMCARTMMKRQKTAHIFLLEHHKAISAVERIRGFVDTIKGHQNYQVVGRMDCLGQTMNALSATRAFLKKRIRFDTFMSLNDTSALGILAAINEKGLTGISGYSVDGAPDLKAIINRESQHVYLATATQSPVQMGVQAGKAAVRLAANKKIKREIITPTHIINSHNISNQSIEGWQ